MSDGDVYRLRKERPERDGRKEEDGELRSFELIEEERETNSCIPPSKVGRLSMDMEDVCSAANKTNPLISFKLRRRKGGESRTRLEQLTDLILPFEDVQPPVQTRFPSLGRFVVLQSHSCRIRVRLSCQGSTVVVKRKRRKGSSASSSTR